MSGDLSEDQGTTIHALVCAWAARQPEAPAVAATEMTLSYGELVAQAAQLAQVLAMRGVGLETRVAVDLPRGAGMVVAYLAVLMAGGTYVPLDANYPAQRRAFILEDADVMLLVTDSPPGDSTLEIVRPADVLAGPAPEPLASPVHVDPANAAYIVYTSGSTGTPKGVVVDHASVVALLMDEERIAVQPGDTVAHLAAAAFDASVFEIWGALCRGGRVAVLDAHVSVAELGQELRRWSPDWLFLTTGLFHLLAQHDLGALDSIGCLLTGGDVLSPRHIRAAAATRARVYAAYGPTETTVFASFHAIDPAPATHATDADDADSS